MSKDRAPPGRGMCWTVELLDLPARARRLVLGENARRLRRLPTPSPRPGRRVAPRR